MMISFCLYNEELKHCDDNLVNPSVQATVQLHEYRGGSRGVFGVWRPPFQIVLILKQALQIIILIGTKIIINLLYFKAPELARLCLGIHIKKLIEHSLKLKD